MTLNITYIECGKFTNLWKQLSLLIRDSRVHMSFNIQFIWKRKMIYKRKSVEKYIFVLEKKMIARSTLRWQNVVWEWQWHTSLCVFRRIHPWLNKMAEKVNFLLSDCLNCFSIYEIWTGKIDEATYIQILISVFQLVCQ